MKHSWSDFKKFEATNEALPPQGEGETKGSQAATAVCKLVYKWFNDGDVFDNRYGLEGWANDISWAANWLYANLPETQRILKGIEAIYRPDDYTELLYDLAETVNDLIPYLTEEEKAGSVYEATGPFEFAEYGEEDEDYW